jgi:hypothetical protein
VTIPYGVTHIGDGAFFQSGLTSVTLPASVSTERNAFQGNPLTSITIGANKGFDSSTFGRSSYEGSFRRFYDSNGEKAGVYTFNNNQWSYSPR